MTRLTEDLKGRYKKLHLREDVDRYVDRLIKRIKASSHLREEGLTVVPDSPTMSREEMEQFLRNPNFQFVKSNPPEEGQRKAAIKMNGGRNGNIDDNKDNGYNAKNEHNIGLYSFNRTSSALKPSKRPKRNKNENQDWDPSWDTMFLYGKAYGYDENYLNAINIGQKLNASYVFDCACSFDEKEYVLFQNIRFDFDFGKQSYRKDYKGNIAPFTPKLTMPENGFSAVIDPNNGVWLDASTIAEKDRKIIRAFLEKKTQAFTSRAGDDQSNDGFMFTSVYDKNWNSKYPNVALITSVFDAPNGTKHATSGFIPNGYANNYDAIINNRIKQYMDKVPKTLSPEDRSRVEAQLKNNVRNGIQNVVDRTVNRLLVTHDIPFASADEQFQLHGGQGSYADAARDKQETGVAYYSDYGNMARIQHAKNDLQQHYDAAAEGVMPDVNGNLTNKSFAQASLNAKDYAERQKAAGLGGNTQDEQNWNPTVDKNILNWAIQNLGDETKRQTAMRIMNDPNVQKMQNDVKNGKNIKPMDSNTPDYWKYGQDLLDYTSRNPGVKIPKQYFNGETLTASNKNWRGEGSRLFESVIRDCALF